MRYQYLKSFNHQSGIEESLLSYTDFHEIMVNRKRMAECHPDVLHEFYVLKNGLLQLLGNGELRKCLDGFREKDFPLDRSVLLKDEFWGHRRVIGLQYRPLLFSRPITLAKPGCICPECGNDWNFANIHDVAMMAVTRSLHLGAFEGKALQYVTQFLGTVRNADYRIFDGKILKRDGVWLGEQDGITNHTIIQEGDELWIRALQYRHLLCEATLRENT